MADIELDAIDLILLAELQNDARATQRELAAAAGIAPSTCAVRLRRLERGGIIGGYRPLVDPAAVGMPVQAFLSVRVRPHRHALVEPFIDHVLALPATRGLFHVAGPDDFLVHVTTTGVGALQRLVLDAFTSREEVVSVHTTLIFEHRPGGPLVPVAPEER